MREWWMSDSERMNYLVIDLLLVDCALIAKSLNTSITKLVNISITNKILFSHSKLRTMSFSLNPHNGRPKNDLRGRF